MSVPTACAANCGRIEAELLRLLPEDGTPVLNRVVRALLASRLERTVDESEYFAVRDALFAQGRIGRLRGQGGRVFFAKPEAAEPDPPSPVSPGWSEAALMDPLRAYLEGPFRASLDLPASGAFLLKNTSVAGGAKGKWAHPDFIVVSAMRHKLMPGAQVDLHSFELKGEGSGSVLAIHEALAQTRFTHFGHFVWYLPVGSKHEGSLDDITVHCEEHGIGLIRIKDPIHPTRPDAVEIIADPQRKSTLDAVVDGFLEAKLSGDQKAALLKAVGANG